MPDKGNKPTTYEPPSDVYRLTAPAYSHHPSHATAVNADVSPFYSLPLAVVSVPTIVPRGKSGVYTAASPYAYKRRELDRVLRVDNPGSVHRVPGEGRHRP